MANEKRPVRYPKHEKVLKSIGIKLKALRIAKGEVNYEKFAFKNDLNRSQVWRYENGEDMKVSSLLKMLNALDVPLHEFFSKNFDDESEPNS